MTITGSAGISAIAGEAAPADTSGLVETLFARSPLGVVLLDFAGLVLRVNETFARIVGATTSSLRGTSLPGHPPAEGAVVLLQALEDARAGRLAAPFETRFERTDGSLATCRLTVAPVRDPAGRSVYAVASVEDLSSIVAAEATLRESETRLRRMFEVSPDAVLLFEAGVVQHANPAALRLLGADRLDQLVGRLSRALIHPDDLARVEQRAQLLIAGDDVPLSEERYIRLDGQVVDVEVSASRVPIPNSKVFVIVLRDVRTRKALEQRARKEREERAAAAEARQRELRLREVIDLLPGCVYARDDAGVIVLANRAFAELLDRVPRDVVGRTAEQLGVPPDIAAASVASDRVVFDTGRAHVTRDEVFVDSAGRRRIFETNRLPFAIGTQATVLCASTEITDKKRLEGELLEAQKLEAIGRLAGGIAHDFNNLLTVLVASAEELVAQRAGTPDPELERILGATSRATALTQQLLDFARRSPVDVRELRINDLVTDLVRLLSRVLGESVRIHTRLDPRAGTVRVDRRSMDRVLMNLAVNARDAMPEGGSLTFSTCAQPPPAGGGEPLVALDVEDTGHGMSEETRARIFEPFYTTKATGAGTGLGLATSFGIVQQAGGRIEVTSELGRGTTFRILLPTTRSAVVEQPVESRPSPSAARGTGTVLLLDDDPFVRSSTARLLKRLGYEVIAVATADEALATARANEGIALLLTDVVMPGQSGPQIAAAIRAFRPQLPVLYVTGYSREDLSLSDESVHLLPKPFSSHELANKMREAMGTSGPTAETSRRR